MKKQKKNRGREKERKISAHREERGRKGDSAKKEVRKAGN